MEIIIIILIFALLLAAVFLIPNWRLKRAIRQVVQIFRRYNVTDVKNAKSGVELGLTPRPFFDRMFGLRDYKPYALTVLIRAGIVLQTEEGKLYLSEDKLMASSLSRGIPQRPLSP